jgi:mannose-6-phosphate isomerase class I
VSPGYEREPTYPSLGTRVVAGWAAAVADVPDGPVRLALDGPGVLDWDRAVQGLAKALRERGRAVRTFDLGTCWRPWEEILAATTHLGTDPNFERLCDADVADLLALPTLDDPDDVLVVHGPGAALTPHDLLWYVDLPKRFAEMLVVAGAAANLGQPTDAKGTTKRLFYVDWPLLDRHRDAIATRVDRWVDARTEASLDGAALRATLAELAARPVRTLPYFNSTPWGGHWAQRELGLAADAPNTAVGYELIAPESGILVGDADALIEVPFPMLVALHPADVLGDRVHAQFGTSFPIRFDYLDTLDGGNLSVHCHPRPDYMREVFGWPYTQHETYYVMRGSPGSRVFLGLRDAGLVERFRAEAEAAAHDGSEFDVERYVQTFPADAHQLFLVPAGTPHASGRGNVVLEISATPYLYSLRFYDWLRRDAAGDLRSVHMGHSFDNLDRDRSGAAVGRDLVQRPRVVREGDGWREELIGALPEMFYEVYRLVLESEATDDTDGRFHLVNVVGGDGVVIETAAGHRHRLAYAETLVLPAAIGRHTYTPLGAGTVRVVKAVVR